MPFYMGDYMSNGRIKICDFTIPELNHIKELANFTSDELSVFELKSRNKSVIEISLELSMSERKISTLTSKIIKKIIRIL